MPIQPDELERLVGRPQVGPVPPFCVDCGYNLTGAVSNRCPECGRSFSRKEWKQKAQETLQRVQEIKDANQWARLGMWIALGGGGLLLLWLVAEGLCITLVLLYPALVAGLAGVFLGLGVFRVRRLPSWADEDLAPPRDYAYAAAAIILGAGVAAAAIFAL